MNRVSFVPVLVALVLLRLPAVVRADAPQDARRAIQARYDLFNRACMHKDFKTVGEVFTPDCLLTLVSEGRSMKASQMVAGMKALSKSLTVSRAKTQILSMKSTGNGYEVAAVWTGYSVYAPAKKAVDDPARQSSTKQNVRDTWQKTDKGWQIVKRLIVEPDDDARPQTKK
jgi:uncharacterized protein (TIGR02246 family)